MLWFRFACRRSAREAAPTRSPSLRIDRNRAACGQMLLTQRFGCFAGTFRAPARRQDHIADGSPHAPRRCDIAREADPVLEFDNERIAGARRCGETVAAGLVSAFFDICAEQPVEQDEYAAKVRIEILDIRRVVHAMRSFALMTAFSIA